MIAVNVSQLLKQPPGATRQIEFRDSLSELIREIELARAVEGRARLTRTSRGILVSSQYEAALRQLCGRCLGPAVTEVHGSSEDEFLPKIDIVTGQTLTEKPDSAELAIDERHVLDLTEVIRQDLLTRMPLQPLCEANCPGLCPECGQELRGRACACRAEEPSSPFAGLAELLARKGSDKASFD